MAVDASPDPAAPCPCGLGLPHGECCGRWHGAFAEDGSLGAPTAEALMRSRFTAFARLGAAHPTDDDGARTVAAMVAYLRATWAAEQRPSVADLTPSPADPAPAFTRLAITATVGGGPFDEVGTVDFTALGSRAGARFRLREHSRFRREDGVWRYVDGDVTG